MNQKAARSEDAVWQLAPGVQLWGSSSAVNCPAGTFLCHLLALSSVSSFRPYRYWSLRTRLQRGLDWSWTGAFLACLPAASLLCVSQQPVDMLVLCVFARAAWRRLGLRMGRVRGAKAWSSQQMLTADKSCLPAAPGWLVPHEARPVDVAYFVFCHSFLHCPYKHLLSH